MDNKMNSNEVETLKQEEQNGVAMEDVSEHTSEKHHSEHHHSSHHHGKHHHSGHHHHHHSSRSKRKKRKMNKKLLWTLLISLAVLLTSAVVASEMLHIYDSGNNSQQNGLETSDILSVEILNREGVLVKEAVRKYLLTDMLNSYNANVRPADFSKNEGRLDSQVPVSLKLSVKSGSAMLYKIELADNERMNHAKVSYFEAASGMYELKHLCANTQYFYRVTVYTNKGTDVQSGSFKTADTPRILSIEGLSNVRDIGNWKTDSGKRIKQGLLLRGTEMDGAVESGYHLTNEGLRDLLEVFGIKTDIDLRAQTSTSKDALGSRVEHRYYDMVMYNEIFTEAGKEKIRMVFADLANPDNYPIYLHCTYGCDRTGTVCYLLEALLGVSRGDCLKDYGLSNLNIANIQAVENGLKSYEGNTLKEQTESYLLSCGVSEYQIESIRDIFLGD